MTYSTWISFSAVYLREYITSEQPEIFDLTSSKAPHVSDDKERKNREKPRKNPYRNSQFNKLRNSVQNELSFIYENGEQGRIETLLVFHFNFYGKSRSCGHDR